MGTHRIEDLLKELGGSIERPRAGLRQEIMNRIPHRLIPHRMDTINIIVDLRISRLAAAAAILVAMVLIGGFLSGRDAAGKRVYEDTNLLLRYTLSGENVCRPQILDSLAKFRDDLTAQGREVVYYGDQVDLKNRYAVLMHWRLPDDEYGVVLADLTARTVSARTLITLQTHMLQEQAGKK